MKEEMKKSDNNEKNFEIRLPDDIKVKLVQISCHHKSLDAFKGKRIIISRLRVDFKIKVFHFVALLGGQFTRGGNLPQIGKRGFKGKTRNVNEERG